MARWHECHAEVAPFLGNVQARAGQRVRANPILSDGIATDAWRKPTEHCSAKLIRRDDPRHPARRIGTPEVIGALAVYLLSTTSSFIASQPITVDSEMTVTMRHA